MGLLWLLIPCAAGLAAWQWMPVGIWEGLAEGLLILFGLLAAALVQIFPVTINFLQYDTLSSEDIDRFGQALEKQQRFWMSLLCLTFSAAFVLLLVMGFKNHHLVTIPWLGAYDLGPFLSGLSAFTATAVFFRAFGIVDGVLSLQRVRTKMLKEAARRAERDKRPVPAVPKDIGYIPEGYGKVHQDKNAH